MKVLHINTNMRGGAGKASTRLHLAMLKSGIESHILFLREKSGDIQNSHSFADFENKYIFIFKNIYHRALSKLLSKFRKYEVVSIAQTPFDILKHPLIKEVDIIHLHWVSKFIDYSDFFRKIDKPIIWTLHDMAPFSDGFHYLTGFDVQYSKWILRINHILKKNALADFHRLYVTAPTKWLLELSEKSSLFSNFKHSVIRNTIDQTVYNILGNKDELRKKYGFSPNDKIILFLADNLNDKRKGMHFFLDALPILISNGYKLLLIGSGSSKYNHRNVIELGTISNNDVLAEVYNISDVYLIASMEDNFPNTIIESMACGTPVVGFHHTGIGEMIVHKHNGYLSEPFSIDSLIEGIDYTVENRESLSKHAIEFIRNECNEQKIVSEFLSLYTTAISQ